VRYEKTNKRKKQAKKALCEFKEFAEMLPGVLSIDFGGI
jgi:carbon monoxide dehydrogenase subunit G